MIEEMADSRCALIESGEVGSEVDGVPRKPGVDKIVQDSAEA